jgi:hypothetical protein
VSDPAAAIPAQLQADEFRSATGESDALAAALLAAAVYDLGQVPLDEDAGKSVARALVARARVPLFRPLALPFRQVSLAPYKPVVVRSAARSCVAEPQEPRF